MAQQQQLDVYRDWLGIKETNRPLNHYQLLLLKTFEDDPAKVRANYRKLNAHVRKYSSGEYSEKSQELLNELAKAMICLTDAKRKAEYDVTLGRKDRGVDRRRTLEEILLASKAVDAPQVERARRFAKAVNVDMRDAFIQQKLVTPEIATQAYAESIGMPFVELADLILEEKLLRKMPVVMARQHSCSPILIDDGQLIVASPNPLSPDVEDQMRLRVGLPVRSVLCTAREIDAVIAKHYPAEAAAAEMAAASAAKTTTTTAKDSAASAAEAAPPLTPEERFARQRNMALIFFNFGFSGFMVVAFVMGMTKTQFMGSIVIGLIVGGTAAMIGWFRGAK